ncbi:MAG: DUF4446 family protein [Chloroflexota bacterium]
MAPSQEDLVIDFPAVIERNIVVAVIGLGAVSLVLLVATIRLLRRTRRLAERLQAITRGSDDRSLEAILEAHLSRVHEVVRTLDEVEARTTVLERDLKRTFARVGLVRYNPFEDTGGNQSFALALLDAHGDGFVLSSLHSRGGTRVYAKGVRGGRSDSAMSGEEEEALRAAMTAPAALPASI